MDLVRWNDDRLDRLEKMVDSLDRRIDTNDRRIDANTGLLSVHDENMKKLSQTGDRRSDRHFQLWLVVAAWIPTIILIILTIMVGAR